MLKTNNEYKMDGQDYKRRNRENHLTETNRNSDKKKKMELDITHYVKKQEQ
jgi:hypothetical protein